MTIAKQLTQAQMERQDIVDNAIHEMLLKVSINGIYTEWDIQIIGRIRDVMTTRLWIKDGFSEQEFYPFTED